MEVGDWVIVKETRFTPGIAGKVGKIVAQAGERFRVDFPGYDGPICWLHHTQIEPHLHELGDQK